MSRDPFNTPPPIDDPVSPREACVDPAGAAAPPPLSEADAERLAVARAEAAWLDRLGALAMAVCEAAAAKAIAELAPAPQPPPPQPPANAGELAAPAPPPPRPARRDPAETFANVSRVVRFTLFQRGKNADLIADLRAGRPRPASGGPRSAAAAPGSASAAASAAAAKAAGPAAPVFNGPAPGDPVDPTTWAWLELPVDHLSAHRNRLRDCIYAVINGDRETFDFERFNERCDRLYAGLIEGERYDAFIHRPLKETVAAICKDLGLEPDWSLWTDEGFPDPLAGANYRGREGLWSPRMDRINRRRERPRAPPAVWPARPPPLRPTQAPYPRPDDP